MAGNWAERLDVDAVAAPCFTSEMPFLGVAFVVYDSPESGTVLPVVAASAPGAQRSKHALRISGTVVAGGPARWSGAMFFPGATPGEVANLTRFQRIRLWARAPKATRMSVMSFARRDGGLPITVTRDVGTRWQQYTLEIADFADLEPYDVEGLFFGATEPGAFVLEIDDLRLE